MAGHRHYVCETYTQFSWYLYVLWTSNTCCFFLFDFGLLLVILYSQILCKLPFGPVETDKPTKPPDTKMFDNIYKKNTVQRTSGRLGYREARCSIILLPFSPVVFYPSKPGVWPSRPSLSSRHNWDLPNSQFSVWRRGRKPDNLCWGSFLHLGHIHHAWNILQSGRTVSGEILDKYLCCFFNIWSPTFNI